MSTPLTRQVTRRTNKLVQGREIIMTFHPMRGNEPVFYFRQAGKRTSYPLLLSDAYRYAALNYARKEKDAKREARKNGTPWRHAKHSFLTQINPPKQ